MIIQSQISLSFWLKDKFLTRLVLNSNVENKILGRFSTI